MKNSFKVLFGVLLFTIAGLLNSCETASDPDDLKVNVEDQMATGEGGVDVGTGGGHNPPPDGD